MRTLAEPRDTVELLERLRAVRPDQPRRWGRMTAHQMVCHVADAFRMATGDRRVSPATGLRWWLLKWVVLYVPLRWPAGIETSPELDQACGGTRPEDFAADVARLEALVERVATPATRLAHQRHPLFGRMSEAQWRRWGYLHMEHHLRQFGA